jgi:NADPH-dependent 2,4-dienoyl-CoA reductase/sulfur reductase-like enzyme
VSTPSHRPARPRTGRIVIVGAGLAAISAAERLRERGYGGELVLVGDEPHRPYNRTPLSKQLLTGDYQPADLRLRTYTDLDAIWRTGTRAIAVDLAARTVTLPHAEQLPFDGLVIATGVEARHLPGTPLHSSRVWMLRTLDDARAIDTAMAHARHVVIVGGGFIGCEIASTTRTRAVDATIIDISPTLLAHSLGHALGAVVGDIHRDAGVRLRLGVGVRRWRDTGRHVHLELDDGEAVTADLAVVGVGTLPRTDWLRGAGLDITDGVLCASTTHVARPDGAGRDGVVAAGDVARWPNPRFPGHPPRRVEHWINAIEMGHAAADALLTGPSRARPFAPAPRFWSEHHGVRIQAVGLPAPSDALTVLDGSLESRRFIAGYTSQPSPRQPPVLRGAVAFDSPRGLLAYRDLIGHPLPAAPAVPA